MIIFLDEERSSQFCGLHLHQLSKLSSNDQIVNVCGGCIDLLHRKEHDATDQFDAAEVTTAATNVAALSAAEHDDDDDEDEQVDDDIIAVARRSVPSHHADRRRGAARRVGERHAVRETDLKEGRVEWRDEALRRALLRDVRIMRRFRHLSDDSLAHQPSAARTLSLAGRATLPASSFFELPSDLEDAAGELFDVSPHATPSLLKAVRERESFDVKLTCLSTRHLFRYLSSLIARCACRHCVVDDNGDITKRCRACVTQQRVNRQSVCKLCYKSLRPKSDAESDCGEGQSCLVAFPFDVCFC